MIEQTLGEGEFGRVLRARALDIGGISGELQLQHMLRHTKRNGKRSKVMIQAYI
jgi:hypothetical protein